MSSRRIEIDGAVPGAAGCARLMFVPTLLLGLGAMGAGFVGAIAGRTEPLRAFLMVACGASMALPAFLVITLRGSTVLDAERGVLVRTARMLGITVRRRELPFGAVSEVGIERHVLKNSVLFAVVVRGASDTEIARRATAQDARQLGEWIARALHRPLRDRGLEREVLRAPEELDVPLRARLGRVPPPEGRPERLAPIGASTFALPSKGAGGATGVLLFLIAVLLLMVWTGALVAGIDGRWDVAVSAAAWSAVTSVIILWLWGVPAMRLAWTRDTVTIDARGVRVDSHFLGTTRTVEIAADEIEEIVLVRAMDRARPLTPSLRGAELVVRGDHAAVSFGVGLPEDDLRWLRQYTFYALSRA